MLVLHMVMCKWWSYRLIDPCCSMSVVPLIVANWFYLYFVYRPVWVGKRATHGV